MRILTSIILFLTLLASGQKTATTKGEKLAEAARAQIGVTNTYDPAYVSSNIPAAMFRKNGASAPMSSSELSAIRDSTFKSLFTRT